jgi:NADH dehydrogenase
MLLKRLLSSGERVRVLLNPNRQSPSVPSGRPIEVAVSTLTDARGVRAAMIGVDQVVHLASAESSSIEADLWSVDVEGTRNLLRAATDAGVVQFIYLSHLGSNPSSAFPLLKTKGLAEDLIRKSGLPFTILRSAPAYGPDDRFTTSLAMLIAVSPLIFPIPGDGSAVIQPIWVEDLAACFHSLLDEKGQQKQEFEVGGPELLTLTQILELIMRRMGTRRRLLPTRQPYLRALISLSSRLLRETILTAYWIDYLASSRTAGLDTLPRIFGLQPARMEDRIDYLADRNWMREFLRRQFGRGEQ